MVAESFSYDSQGNLRFRTTRKGQVIEFQYDLANRLVKKIMQPGQPEEIVRDLVYDLANNVTSVVDPDSALAFTYDILSRQLTASTAGAPFQPAVTLTATYDANDNRLTLDDPIGESIFLYDVLDRLEDLETPSLPGQSIIYAYDALSRRSGRTLPNGVATTVDFRGRLGRSGYHGRRSFRSRRRSRDGQHGGVRRPGVRRLRPSERHAGLPGNGHRRSRHHRRPDG